MRLAAVTRFFFSMYAQKSILCLEKVRSEKSKKDEKDEENVNSQDLVVHILIVMSNIQPGFCNFIVSNLCVFITVYYRHFLRKCNCIGTHLINCINMINRMETMAPFVKKTSLRNLLICPSIICNFVIILLPCFLLFSLFSFSHHVIAVISLYINN